MALFHDGETVTLTATILSARDRGNLQLQAGGETFRLSERALATAAPAVTPVVTPTPLPGGQPDAPGAGSKLKGAGVFEVLGSGAAAVGDLVGEAPKDA